MHCDSVMIIYLSQAYKGKFIGSGDISIFTFQLITCPAMITTPLRPLSLEFTCPICLRLMRHTMLVMECLHRFCSECIQKCLRVGKKECPSCRIHIPSRRSLRLVSFFCFNSSTFLFFHLPINIWFHVVLEGCVCSTTVLCPIEFPRQHVVSPADISFHEVT